MNSNQLLSKLSELKDKYILAIHTDKVDFTDSIDNAETLLEVRVFDEHSEFRAYRSTVDAEFICREITDDSSYADGFFTQSHYLDIDTTRSSGNVKTTTGGGTFHLPAGVDDTMLKVVFYYRFDDEGIAQTFDWRLAGFTSKEDWNNGTAQA